ncbi:MAG TPA: phosphatase PAP2 family protein [Solirubrobacteraceae bacterium]|jgi:membrane-associated phospholipid phosphatase|nr:phosphatase PAP2 family protein [Solirubrobacteraceae bacterium]
MPAAGAIDARLAGVLRAGPAARWTACFSRVGDHGGIWFALGATMSVLGAPQRRSVWRAATGRVAAAYALNTAVKLAVRRRRPAGGLVSTPTQLSFPSAHAATSFAGARAYTRAGGPPVVLYALAVSLALSRLRLGVHHPSDVFAGAVLGLLVGGCGPTLSAGDAGQEGSGR